MIELRELFDIQYGNKLDLNKQEIDDNGINFVNRSSNNLGISCKIEAISNIKPFDRGLISVSLGGSILESFVQPEKFYTGQNVKVLTPKIDLTHLEKLYYCLCIKKNAYRYGAFGREANKTLDSIKIPSLDEIPNYVNTVNVKAPSNKVVSNKQLNLNDREWKWFKITKLFDVKGSKSNTKTSIQDYGVGKYPYVVTSSINNGIEGFYNYYTEEGNVLTIDSATIGSCFYQVKNFSASDHVEKLIPKFNMSCYLAMFLTCILNKEQYRYGYGRKFSQKRIKNTKIKLPVTSEGQPDWEFMEDYIKSLPYSSNL